MNKVILMGRLTDTPELKTTNSGIEVTSFSIAVDRGYAKKGEERQTDFINCVAWRQRASFITKYFVKGQLIAVEGTLQVRPYQDKNGNKRNATEVVIDNAFFTGDKRSSNGGSVAPTPTAPAAPAAEEEDFSEIDDLF